MKLAPLICFSLMLASSLVFVPSVQAGKKKDKDSKSNKSGGVRTYRPHIKPTPSKVNFISEGEVSGRLNEKHQSGVITFTLDQIVLVDPYAPKPVPSKPATGTLTVNSGTKPGSTATTKDGVGQKGTAKQ